MSAAGGSADEFAGHPSGSHGLLRIEVALFAAALAGGLATAGLLLMLVLRRTTSLR
jgi:hypothetical protein